MIRRFSLRYTLFLFLSDIALVVSALLIATWLRINIPLGQQADPSQWVLPLPVYGMAIVLFALTFITLNVYDPKRALHLVGELQMLTTAALIAVLMLTGALYFSYRLVSRLQVVYFALLFLGLLYAHRAVLRLLFYRHDGQRLDARQVLVIGTGEAAANVAMMTREYAWAGLHLAGFIASPDGDCAVDESLVLGAIDDTLHVVSERGISEVIVALPVPEQHNIRPLIYELQEQPLNLNVRVMPDYFDLAFLQVSVEDFGGMPLITLKEPTLDPFQRVVKRAFDLVVTLAAMVPALPLLGLIALAIKLDSPGPALYYQERVGEGGRLFKMIKFRSMVVDADKRLDEVVQRDEEGNIFYKRVDDPRVTRVGRFLRRTSLDELPQLFNVLKGDMSLVGPRPELPWLVREYEPWQRKRFEVPQGMTGWWQINGRAERPMHLYTEEDLFYIRNYSLWLDVRILWRTAGIVLTGRGAY